MTLPFAPCHWQGGIGLSNCLLRGGAFNNNDRNVRCAARIRNNPNNRNDNIGFRVVLRTFFFHTGIAWRFVIGLPGRGEKMQKTTSQEWRSLFRAATFKVRANNNRPPPVPIFGTEAGQIVRRVAQRA